MRCDSSGPSVAAGRSHFPWSPRPSRRCRSSWWSPLSAEPPSGCAGVVAGGTNGGVLAVVGVAGVGAGVVGVAGVGAGVVVVAVVVVVGVVSVEFEVGV